MNEKESRRHSRKIFSMEEKRNYCIAWEKSGMNQTAFCKESGISKSALGKWSKELKKEDKDSGFAPLVLDKQHPIKQVDMIQLNMSFPNQMQLSLSISEHRLISFIQEMSYATTVVR